MKGPAQKQAYINIEVEFENIRTAWNSLISNNRRESAIQRILPVLFHYTELRGKTIELRTMLEFAIRSLDASRKDAEQQRAEIVLQTAHSAFFLDGYPLRYSVHDAIFPIDLKNIQKIWGQANQSGELHELGFWGILLAYIYGRLFNLREGMRQIKKMIPYFQRQDQPWELANAYLHLLKLMVPNRENPNDQVQFPSSYLSQATDIFDSLGDRINEGHILVLWGDLKFLRRDMKGAIDQWNAARALYTSVGEWGTATNVIWSLIDASLQVGDFPKAYAACAEMAESYMQHGLRTFAVGVFSKESLEKSRHGDLAEAIQIRQRCIDMIHETGLEYQYAWNYWEMGELVRLSGDLPGAANWFERAIKIFENEKDHVGRSFYYRGMGDVAMAKGDFRSARQHFLESVSHSRTANHTWMIAYTENGLGRSELALGHYAAAEKHALEALRQATRSGDQGIILVVLAAYAELLYQQGKVEKSLQLASLVSSHILTWHETRKQATALLVVLKKSTPSAKIARARTKGDVIDVWRFAKDLIEQR
jgi:tetratricopeptide (TPR) repeat protein